MQPETALAAAFSALTAASLPFWPHSRRWGYYPSGVFGFFLVATLIYLLL